MAAFVFTVPGTNVKAGAEVGPYGLKTARGRRSRGLKAWKPFARAGVETLLIMPPPVNWV